MPITNSWCLPGIHLVKTDSVQVLYWQVLRRNGKS